jgi:hypothetical protein
MRHAAHGVAADLRRDRNRDGFAVEHDVIAAACRRPAGLRIGSLETRTAAVLRVMVRSVMLSIQPGSCPRAV